MVEGREGSAPAVKVSLREVTAQNVRDVCRLAVDPAQLGYVAPNAVSLAEALVNPEAWYRAIYADDALAGFVMVWDESLRVPRPAAPNLGLWRLMVDARFQGKGIGRAALEQVIAHVRGKGVSSRFVTSYVPGPASPEPFYSKLGFRPTGEMDGDEVVLELLLAKTFSSS